MNSAVLKVHRFVARPALGSIVFPTEGDAALVTGEEPTVGDSNTMGVAQQIGENRLGPCELALGLDDPLTLTQRREPISEGRRIGQITVFAEERQSAATMSVLGLFEEAAQDFSIEAHPIS